MKEITKTEILEGTNFKKVSYDGRRFYLALNDKGEIIVNGVLRYKDTFIMVEATGKIFYGTKTEIDNYISDNKLEQNIIEAIT